MLNPSEFKRAILAIDALARTATVQPGVRNLAISEAAAAFGLYYAPDPSSQIACTIGGNVAENSGGVHCLKYGLTVHNLRRVRGVLITGEVVEFGSEALDAPGYDLLALICGSEGLLAIITEVTVKLTPMPREACCVMATFDEVAQVGAAVAAIIGAGIVPVAMEYMDKPAIHICENFAHAGYPLDVEAMLIIEVEGSDAEMRAMLARIGAIAKAHNVRTARESMSAMESAQIWKAANRRSERPGGWPITSAWTAPCRPAVCRRRFSAPARFAPRSGFGSPTSFTPATATCIR